MPNPPAVPFFNSQTPAPTAGYQNAKFQTDGNVPVQSITTEVPNTGKVNLKTTSYTLVAADCGKLVVYNSSGAGSFTLPPTPPFAQWMVAISNIGTGVLTVSPNGLNLDGTIISLTLGQDVGILIYTDGTNYFSIRGEGIAPKPYHIVSFLPDKPDAGVPASKTGEVCQWVCPGNLTNGVAFLANFANSTGYCQTAPTSTAAYSIYKIPSGSSPGIVGTQIGTISIATSGVFTFTSVSGLAYAFVTGDILSVWAPSVQDATLAGVSFTLAGVR